MIIIAIYLDEALIRFRELSLIMVSRHSNIIYQVLYLEILLYIYNI